MSIQLRVNTCAQTITQVVYGLSSLADELAWCLLLAKL